MKMYEKTYESVYDSEWTSKKFDLNNVTTDIGLDVDEYKDLFRKEVVEFENKIFEHLVRLKWLKLRFHYKRKQIKTNKSGFHGDSAYGIFLNNHVGFRPTAMNATIFTAVRTYFHDFFPYLEVMNPFKDEVKYPYKYMRFSHLYFIHQMSDRLALLEHGEKKKMPFGEFADFAINHALCFNDEKGKEVYKLSKNFEVDHLYIRLLSRKKPYTI